MCKKERYKEQEKWGKGMEQKERKENGKKRKEKMEDKKIS